MLSVFLKMASDVVAYELPEGEQTKEARSLFLFILFLPLTGKLGSIIFLNINLFLSSKFQKEMLSERRQISIKIIYLITYIAVTPKPISNKASVGRAKSSRGLNLDGPGPADRGSKQTIWQRSVISNRYLITESRKKKTSALPFWQKALLFYILKLFTVHMVSRPALQKRGQFLAWVSQLPTCDFSGSQPDGHLIWKLSLKFSTVKGENMPEHKRLAQGKVTR